MPLFQGLCCDRRRHRFSGLTSWLKDTDLYSNSSEMAEYGDLIQFFYESQQDDKKQ